MRLGEEMKKEPRYSEFDNKAILSEYGLKLDISKLFERNKKFKKYSFEHYRIFDFNFIIEDNPLISMQFYS